MYIYIQISIYIYPYTHVNTHIHLFRTYRYVQSPRRRPQEPWAQEMELQSAVTLSDSSDDIAEAAWEKKIPRNLPRLLMQVRRFFKEI